MAPYWSWMKSPPASVVREHYLLPSTMTLSLRSCVWLRLLQAAMLQWVQPLSRKKSPTQSRILRFIRPWLASVKRCGGTGKSEGNPSAQSRVAEAYEYDERYHES